MEWRRQIGAYDVVLLRPVGEETVVAWLNANGFGVPDKAVPILEDYIREQWWMVAIKIHPDSLTDITQEKLASGLLDPLELIFESPTCLFPMRLTSIAAGPVEELIYIEGPTHYEPLTYADDKWQVQLFGGPIQQVPDGKSLPTVEYTAKIIQGRAETLLNRHLTKLRRVFDPEEMTADILFAPMDYAKLLGDGSWWGIAQGATQYGRHRDPNGIPHLLSALSPQALEEVRPAPEDYLPWPVPSAQVLNLSGYGKWSALWRQIRNLDGTITTESGCGHIRSCLWALGEIAIDHNATDDTEELLLACANHENELIRVEAYVALLKAGSQRIGQILLDRLALFLHDPVHLATSWGTDSLSRTEMDIVADWLTQYGTLDEREAFLDAIADAIAGLPIDLLHTVPSDEWGNVTLTGWPAWLFDRAMASDDTRFIAVLQGLRAQMDNASPLTFLLLKAEAARGSEEAIQAAAHWLAESESRILPELEGDRRGGYADIRYSLQPNGNLRTRVLRSAVQNPEGLLAFPEVNDTILRMALSEYKLDDWYRLSLLAQVEHVQDSDRQMLLAIWDTNEQGKRIIVVDILWLWGDSQTMRELYEQCNQKEVRSEIERMLLSLEASATVQRR